MAENLSISKTKSSFPDYLDWSKLRALGIKHIEQLGSSIWTDYNLHDPGITILEVLCYALTDLGYRTNFDIKDILTRSEAQKVKEELNAFGQARDNNFFTAAEILSCNPVTVTDLRKLLIDIKGVKNAWLEPAERGEIPIYLDHESQTLKYRRTAAKDDCEIKIRGLYDVCIEPEPVFTTDPCGRSFFSTEDIVEEVKKVLHRHRNLCEDIRDVFVFREEKIGICTDIEIAPDADPEDVLLAIYKKIEEFLSPTLQFYTLQEMLSKGKRIEEIFEGRPLNRDSHGFVDPDELKKLDQRENLYASDLIEMIMDVPEVLAVHKFFFQNFVNDLPQTKPASWCLKLTPKHRPHLALEKGKSTIKFFKGSLQYPANIQEVEQRYLEERIAKNKVQKDAYELDLFIPEGNSLPLDDYYSIQNDFPVTYGIGEEGIKGIPTRLRRAQAQQLKAYLLFFDQILANYLSQLAHVRDLFSFRTDDHPLRQEADGAHTYFVHLLREVPGVDELIRNFNDCPADEGYLSVPENYPDYLQFISESLKTYQERRNRFLDHLLARFAESFTDYVLLTFKVNGQRQSMEQIIQDKADFLTHYPEISRNRGKAFNYRPAPDDPDQKLKDISWDDQNISGLERRVSKLLGIDEDQVGRHTLTPTQIVELPQGWIFEIKNEEGDPWIRSSSFFASVEAARQALAGFFEQAASENNYRRLDFSDGVGSAFSFLVVDEKNAPLAECLLRYAGESERNLVLQRLISRIKLRAIGCEIIQAQECFFFYLLCPESGWPLPSGDNILFVSHHGYKTAEEAESALQQLLTLGIDHHNYVLEAENTDGPFGFYLQGETGPPLADHPKTYTSEQERNAWLQAIIYYLNGGEPPFDVDEVRPGHYQFEVKDGEGNLLFISAEEYPTEAEARAGFHLLQKLARYRVYYHLIDDMTGDQPFSFELKDRKGNVLAYHPHSYATDCERDLIMEAIIYCATNEEHAAFIIPDGEAFIYQLRDKDGKILMQSSSSFPDEIATGEAWQRFIDFAHRAESYRLIEKEEDPKPFTFDLLDDEGQVIAFHPHAYEYEAERAAAMLAVSNFVCHTSFLVNISGDPGAYYFLLLGNDNEALLRSVSSYPGWEAARMAFYEFLPFGREFNNYVSLTGSGFEVRNHSGEALAENTMTFDDEQAREATMIMVLAYLRNDAVQTDVVNTEGVYRIQIMDASGTVGFQGLESFYSREAADQATTLLLSLAADAQYYKRNESGKGNCIHGFHLENELGEIVAFHPFNFPDADSRDAEMATLFAHLTSGEHLEDDALKVIDHFDPVPGAYTFEIKDFTKQVLLEFDLIFTTAEQARHYYRNVFLSLAIEASNYRLEYNNQLCIYTIDLYATPQADRPIARHPVKFRSRRERDMIFQELLYLLRKQDVQTSLEGTDCGYYFHLKPEGQTFELISTDRYPTELLALRACHQIADYLADTGTCAISEMDQGFHVGISAPEGIIFAATTVPFSDELSALSACEAIKDAVEADLDMDAEPNFVPRGFRCQIVEKSEVWLERSGRSTYSVYLEWPLIYESRVPRDEALQAFKTFILGLANGYEPEYRDESESGSAGSFRFVLPYNETGELHELVSAEVYSSEENAKEAFFGMLAALKQVGGMERNSRSLDDEENCAFTFEIIDGPGREAAYETACSGCSEMLEEGQTRDSYLTISNREDCYFSFELSYGLQQGLERNNLIASHALYYSTEAARNEAIQKLLYYLGREGMHVVEHLLLRPFHEGPQDSYYFELTDGQTVFFRSVYPYFNVPAAERDFRRAIDVFTSYNTGDPPPSGIKVEMLSELPVDTGETEIYTYRLVDAEGNCYADTSRCFAGIEEIVADLGFIKEFLETSPEGPIDTGETGLGAETGEVSISGLPFKDDESAILSSIKQSAYTAHERQGDALLAPIGDCEGQDGIPCSQAGDPYSFRASVILPYWPERFRKPEFRAFIERTLRQEAPAHVFLRICWISPCQMRAFETAYRSWLENLALGRDSCGYTPALNALIDILFRLRNVYPEARLSPCEGTEEGAAPVILNQTVLGNANFSNDDNG
jgi:hypothetical protein